MKQLLASNHRPTKQTLRAVLRLASVALAAAAVWTPYPSPAEPGTASIAPPNPALTKLPFSFPTGMENTPVVFKGRPLLVDNHRPGGFKAKGQDAYLFITDLTTGQEVARFGKSHSFVSAFVSGPELNVFATEFTDFGHVINTKCINRFTSTDLKTWKQELALAREGAEQFFNTSVCQDDQGYLLAYESDIPVKWCFRFARSKDLSHWERIRGLEFADVEGQSACANPTIRYLRPYYYMIYGIHRDKMPRIPYHYALSTTKYATFVARSKDLAVWELSPTRAPMLDPSPGEGINNTDADLFELDGNTYLFYATGDQATWGTIREAMYAGSMRAMFDAYFPVGAPTVKFDAKLRKYTYPVPAQDPSPQVSVSSIRRVFHNGEHNAFTDLCRFRGDIYLTFRSCPDGHMVHATASTIVLRSRDDGATWEQVHRFSVKDRDTRDPHFLVFRDRLFVYTGTWYNGPGTIAPKDYDLNQHLGFAAWSDDGTAWTSPVLLDGTFGHYVWRAAAFDGKAYLCGRRKPGFDVGPRGEGEKVQSLMLESDDGIVWKKRAFFQETAGDETAFLFENDGSVLGVGRHGSDKSAQLLRATPPYTEWVRKDLGRPVGGPLIARWGDRILVGGRKTTKESGPKTSLYWLVGDTLKESAEFPSGGDNSYPGFVELSPSRALVSYYSSHERDASGKTITAIYLAEITLQP